MNLTSFTKIIKDKERLTCLSYCSSIGNTKLNEKEHYKSDGFLCSALLLLVQIKTKPPRIHAKKIILRSALTNFAFKVNLHVCFELATL